MQKGANYLVGQHDFTTFRHVHCQAQSPVKTIDSIQFSESGDHVFMDIAARSFLHHQVRSIIGTLKLVGTGKWQPEQVREILEAKDRAALGFNVF